VRIAILGAGYVGSCTAAVLAEQGHDVVLADPDRAKVKALQTGTAPAHEPGLDAALGQALRSGRLAATADSIAAVREAALTMLCVGTPPRPDGSQDQRFLRTAARQVGLALKDRPGWHCVVVKSTVLPRTTQRVVLPAVAKASGRRPGEGFGVAVNPEFLREGQALKDARQPDRIVVGALDEASARAAWALWEGVEAPRLTTDLPTAEFLKLASNAFLAAKVGLANELANVAAEVGVDWYAAAEGIGMDARIGPQFLRAGAGFGGSCFPKDAAALLALSKDLDRRSRILDAVLQGNEAQPREVVRLAKEALGNLKGKRIALLGLAFKADTDDVRATRALPIWQALRRAGADVVCWDPVAGPNFQALAGKGCVLAPSLEAALDGAHGAVVQAEWPHLQALGPQDFVKRMARPLVVDGRRTWDPAAMRAGGVDYRAIGLGRPRRR
jgi:UDPglucose 6-dehydrogenase